jgi:diguanylate cyclase (GGDEF)-like protein
MKNNKLESIAILSIIFFSVVIMGIVLIMTLSSFDDHQRILEESVKAQLISTSIAAMERIDVERFYAYNSLEDIYNDIDEYMRTLAALRELHYQTGVGYIYALKKIGDDYYFIFDTDPEMVTPEDIFEVYRDISQVHLDAFDGIKSAGIMNVSDEYGDFSTGAVPIWKNGRVVGVVSTDIDDIYIKGSREAAVRNTITLFVTLAITMGILTIIVWQLMRRVSKMQDKLYHMANYDTLTGLPNRQYLMDYLTKITDGAKNNHEAFALMLIDIDNFKRVNDSAGHDAGDELLCLIANYLDSVDKEHKAKSFRPSAGVLNVSARIGGDEFIKVIPDISTVEQAEIASKHILENLHSGGIDRFIEEFDVGLSIGVAVFPYHSENFHVLIKYADLAMYYAKKTGKHSHMVYNDELGNIEDGDPPHPDRRGHRR